MNKFFTPAAEYNKPKNTTDRQGYEVNKVGGLTKTHKIISIRERRDRIEEQFMNISFKANRADAQREARKAKR